MTNDWWATLVAGLGSTDFTVALRSALGLLLIVLAGWTALTVLVSLVNRDLAVRIAPPLLRAVLVAGVTTSLITPAHAEDSTVGSLSGLLTPDRPTTPHRADTATVTVTPTAPPSADPAPTPVPAPSARVTPSNPAPDARDSSSASRAASSPSARHVVEPGDTLWAIAASRLAPHADDATIATAVDQWYATNRAVIGDDPNLIHPGQELQEPRP